MRFGEEGIGIRELKLLRKMECGLFLIFIFDLSNRADLLRGFDFFIDFLVEFGLGLIYFVDYLKG